MALPVVPLTISMEMLAEAATALLPNKLLLGMKDIRAYRWIALDENRLTLELIAKRNANCVRGRGRGSDQRGCRANNVQGSSWYANYRRDSGLR